MFASGPVAKAALAFSPAEYFALAILGLTVVSVAALGSTMKGLAMGALGIAISLIGVDSILGAERYTFGYRLSARRHQFRAGDDRLVRDHRAHQR